MGTRLYNRNRRLTRNAIGSQLEEFSLLHDLNLPGADKELIMKLRVLANTIERYPK